jgi:hypothetical protein
MQEKYLGFHKLKNELIKKLLSIEDGATMNSLSDNCLEEISNKEVVEDCLNLMITIWHDSKQLAQFEENEV